MKGKYAGIVPSYSTVVGEWLNYRHQECNRRNVTIYVRMMVDPDRRMPLSVLYPRSRSAYVYVATRGFVEASGLLYRYDNVVVEVVAVERDVVGGREVRRERVVARVRAEGTSNYVDNTRSLGRSKIDLAKTVEVVVRVSYLIVGEEPFYCYFGFLDFTLYCGATYDRHLRLGYYVEIIPEELFG